MLTLLSFLFFTALVGILTVLLTRGDDHRSTAGYFLAGRTLTGGYIAGSLMLTNLSTEQLVGLNGAAFADGLCVMAWEVVAGVALALMAMWFLPRFLKSGIATVPEFLEYRFGKSTRTITTFLFVLAYTLLLLPIILYTGARGLEGMLDVRGLVAPIATLGERSSLTLVVWIVGLVGSAYAIFGGLRAIAVSDTLNGFGLILGGFAIAGFGLGEVAARAGSSGVFEGMRILREADPERFHSMGPATSSVPFSTLFTGVLLLNLFYWCTNQQIIQRTLGAKNLAEGQRGVLLAGFLKLLGPMILVLPGIIAFHLFRDRELAQDAAYGTLVRAVLPHWMSGFFAAVMVGAILSSFNSALNATATLFSLGIYKGLLRPSAGPDAVVRSGKWFSALVALAAMLGAPLLMEQKSIFEYLQQMNGIYFIPLFAVIVTGMVERRADARAANIALLFGLIAMALGSFAWKDAIEQRMYFFHFMGIVFLATVAAQLAFGRMWRRESPWVQEDSGEVDLAPWRFATPAAALLLVCVLAIYISFA
ncbi:MAG TPA: solute:sodium symporter family transporter [Planctomycetes bacterium]|nr:solute:sodium symporter family transporter [Planctomycetota bacterium]